jgi:hypothetical protein
VFSIAYPLCTGALVVNISASYLGETVGPGQAYARAFRKLWRLLTAQAWATMLVLFGLLLCVVPGVVLSLQLSLVPLVVLLEDRTAWAALGRSRALMADNLGKAFALAAIVWLLDIVASAAISTAVHFVPWPFPLIEDFVAYLLIQIGLAGVDCDRRTSTTISASAKSSSSWSTGHRDGRFSSALTGGDLRSALPLQKFADVGVAGSLARTSKLLLPGTSNTVPAGYVSSRSRRLSRRARR